MQKKLIYLIDDDEVSNFITSKTITIQSFEKTIKIYENGALAVESLRKEDKDELSQSFDELIIFLDINMPVMNGWEFLKSMDATLVSRLIPIKLVMLTSSIDQEDVNHSRSFEIVKDYIVKPLTPSKLEEAFPHLYK